MSERYNIVQMNRFQFKMHDDEWHYGMVPDITYESSKGSSTVRPITDAIV